METLVELGLEAIESKRSKTVGEKITDFFKRVTNVGGYKQDDQGWLNTIYESGRKKFEGKEGTLNNRILEGVNAGNNWAKAEKIKENRCGLNLNNSSGIEQIQDQDATPVLIGCDVIGLYPNLDPVCIAELCSQAVKKTEVKFKSVNMCFLVIYLCLTLGRSKLEKLGLSQCLPKYKGKDSIKSLTATQNRDTMNWDFSKCEMNEESRRNLIAILLQVMILLLTSTTCYRFGGRIYRQKKGLGIGLRASAAIARLIMCTWDSTWGRIQQQIGLVVLLFARYVDDIRLYLKPI